MKLVSLNIEKRNHLDEVRAFLEEELADVVALMEVCEVDLDALLHEYPYRMFGKNCRLVDGHTMGVCLASREIITQPEVYFADGKSDDYLPEESEGVGMHRPVVVMGRVGEVMMATTHFAWTPAMSESDEQRADLVRLLDHLQGRELVLCGDFNIPRGNSTYQLLAERYRDNVPNEISTTIDFDLHRAKREGVPRFEAVVDYVWTTSMYTVSDVRVVDGVSDHCGLVAHVGFGI